MKDLAALHVLAEPRRVAILDLLRDGERPVGELVDGLGVSQPAVSKHLRVLKDAGLVEARVDAQRRLYRIRPEPLADLDEWLAPYRRLWASAPRPTGSAPRRTEEDMTDATLLMDRARPAVRLERHLPDPPATVWQALTQCEQLRAWFPSDVIVDGGRWVVGARITFPFPPEVIDMTLTGEVLEVDEPNALAFTWGEETLRFELARHDGGTRLVLIDELPASAAARNAAGWDACLDRLAGLEAAPDEWQPRFRAYAAEFEAVIGPQEGPPPGYKGAEAERHGSSR